MSDRPSISVFFKLNKNTDALTDVKVCSRNTCKADFYSAVIALTCKIMEQDFTERRDKLQEEIDQISRTIQSSTGRGNVTMTDDLKKIIMTYGSVNKALKAQADMQEQKEKLEKKGAE